MTSDQDGPTVGDVVQAYQQLDDTGRRVFCCAFLHIWAARAARARGETADCAGGHWRDWGVEVLGLPKSNGFGHDLEIPMPSIFEAQTSTPTFRIVK